MPSLAEFQARAAAYLRAANDVASLFAPGAISVEDGLAIYRGNVLAAAANALRLTFPTVDRLVGETFFNQLCAKRVEVDPPQSGNLSDYCGQFPHFLRAVEHLHGLPYLVDVARFDLELERVANADRRQRSPRIALDANTVLVLEPSLACLRLDYPADEIRAAIERDEEALARIDMAKGARWRALWRGARGVELRPLSRNASLFLSAVLSRRGLENALEEAEALGAGGVARDIEHDIITSPFTRILTAEGSP